MQGFEINGTVYREIISYSLCSKTRTLSTRQRVRGDEAKDAGGKKLRRL